MFGGEKKRREELGREKISEKYVSFWSGACLGLFIAPGAKIEAMAIVKLLSSKLL